MAIHARSSLDWLLSQGNSCDWLSCYTELCDWLSCYTEFCDWPTDLDTRCEKIKTEFAAIPCYMYMIRLNISRNLRSIFLTLPDFYKQTIIKRGSFNMSPPLLQVMQNIHIQNSRYNQLISLLKAGRPAHY